MIVRFAGAGKSFKGLIAYLSHDPKAKTAERVGWTRTLNLANDDIGSAVNEMLWTYRSADLLKQEAGVRAGGRRLESPAKHLSLGWHPSEQPSKEEMVAAVESLMRHLGWQDHQAVLVAHTDKHYRHVHVMLNAVSPIDGRSIDTGFERARASAWALDYERSRFQIHCEERLKPYEERAPAPTRESWLKMKEAEQQFDKAEAKRVARAPDYFERGDPAKWKAKEWEALRAHQKDERTEFFVEGKQAYREVRNQVFREVRTEYRPEWSALYSARRSGLDPDLFAIRKADILSRQNPELEARRDEACTELRHERDAEYEQLLLHHREERAELRERQDQGQRSPQLLGQAYEPNAHPEHDRDSDAPSESQQGANFRGAADEVCEPDEAEAREREPSPGQPFESSSHEHLRVRDGLDIAGGLGLGAIGAIADVAERVLEGFFGGGESKKPPRETKPIAPSPKETRDRAARGTEAEIRSVETQASEAARLHAYWEERRQRRRTRDRD